MKVNLSINATPSNGSTLTCPKTGAAFVLTRSESEMPSSVVPDAENTDVASVLVRYNNEIVKIGGASTIDGIQLVGKDINGQIL